MRSGKARSALWRTWQCVHLHPMHRTIRTGMTRAHMEVSQKHGVGMQRQCAAIAAHAHQGAVTDTNHGAALADWSAVRRSKLSSVSLTMCPEGSSA